MERNRTVHIIFRPQWEDGIFTNLQVQLSLGGFDYAKGELFDALPLSIAGCSCSVYHADTFRVSDAKGCVDMEFREGIGMYGSQREYAFGRETSGTITITYDAEVERFNPFARNPGFSLLAHDYALTGAGLAFLLLPDGECNYHVECDFSNAGENASAIAGLYNENFALTLDRESLKNIYYAMGNLQEHHVDGSSLYIYTVDKDNLLFEEFIRTAQIYYDYISNFFHDQSDRYHIILYPTRRTQLTGTALPGICYMGLGNKLIQHVSEVENILAHELTHNWCYVTGDDMMSSLFTEGTAEFYSCYMQYHTGQTDMDGYVEAFNTKLRGFYCHPTAREESFKEIYDKSWTHSYCQKIPYIKGTLLCMQLDYLMRQQSEGKKSLDDLVHIAADEVNAGVPMTFDDFQKLANELTNSEAQKCFDEAMTPGIAVPDSNFFGDAYEIKEETIPIACEGFDPTVRFTDNVIRGLIPGSNAEKAGLQNGDVILRMIADDSDPSVPTQIQVQRGEEILDFTYLAQGANVPCWQYRKK
jgi:hypothetical protein